MDQRTELIYKAKKYLNTLLQEKNINIHRILLFGSYAQQSNKEDSDIDLIVVSPDFRNKSLIERINLVYNVKSKLVEKFFKPFDILYCSDEEWEDDSNMSVIRTEAKKYGKEIYSANYL